MTITVGIYGATGYTGLELVQILQRHPAVEIGFVSSQTYAGQSLQEVFAQGPDLTLTTPADVVLAGIDLVFLCLPHGAAAETAVVALEAGVRVIDLSADFRLKDQDIYEQWYQTTHPAPALLSEAVYGLTEFARDALPGARLVANPGCYPTSVLLGVQPLLAANAVAGTIIADSKSGVSGAGRKPKLGSHFVEVVDNFSPYSIGRSHRHLPEMEQGFGLWQAQPPSLIFSPHLLPVPRGILSTIYIPLRRGWELAACYDLYDETYAGEPFVRLLPLGKIASLAHVNHTNQCAIGMTMAADTLIITAAIDNLIKGAAGQAVQNMNVVLGFEETLGLD